MECEIVAWDNFWNPPSTFLGSMALATAIFVRALYYFSPRLFSPKFTPRMANWLTGIIALGGLAQIVIAALGHGDYK